MANFDVATGVVWEQVDVKVMLIDQASNELVTLNQVGSLVWKALASEPTSVSALAEIVTAEFPEVGLAQATTDVEAFIEELARLGLVSSGD
ncbi:MAG TPA: PqqD family protein [Acidimicrobiia bacterium]|nr:PqqD family protein [Acidimicrobiia bacterium]